MFWLCVCACRGGGGGGGGGYARIHALLLGGMKENSKFSITLVTRRGYDLLTLRSPSNILGSSDGFTGSTATLITDCVLNFRGWKIWAWGEREGGRERGREGGRERGRERRGG